MKMETLPAARKARGARAKPRRWFGAVEGMHGNQVFGWALDTEQPNQRVIVEVLLGGEPLATQAADVARADLAVQFQDLLADGRQTDVCHGFVVDLSQVQLPADGVLTVRVANTDVVISGQIELALPPAPPATALSYAFSDGALRVYGWAKDMRNPQRKVVVHAYAGAQLLATTIADRIRPMSFPHEPHGHGFTLSLPIALGDGTAHEVRITDEYGQPLNGSPLSVCCYADGCKALIPEHDALFERVIDNYERYQPRHLDMRQYQAWSARFETPATLAPLPPSLSALTVGILVCGGDTALSEQTFASLSSQTHGRTKIFSLEAWADYDESGLPALLEAALGAGCDVIAVVRAGDILAPHAVAAALAGFGAPEVRLVYTDSERAGRPWFKPAWNAEYALASDYPLDLLFVRAAAVQALPRPAWSNGATLGWSLLASAWQSSRHSIVHVPRILLHSAAHLDAREQQARFAAAAAALRSLEPDASLQALDGPADNGFVPRRVARALRPAARQSKVSLIIPTRDRVELLERCITSIMRHTAWDNLEIIVVDNDSVLAKTKTYFRKLAKLGVRVLPAPGPFNFAALNNMAVAAASGEIVGLINNDIEALHDGWLDEIISHLQRPDVGAVGAKLLWPNGMVQHGGVLMGVHYVASHYGNWLAERDWGDHGRNQLVQQVTGVTAACLFMRKQDYLAVGGMDEIAFPVTFNDVDLCLKLRHAGKTIVWTPHATLLHAESASRGTEDTPEKRARAAREVAHLRQRWGQSLQHDPAYHPSLTLDVHSAAFSGLALPPRKRAPRSGDLLQPD